MHTWQHSKVYGNVYMLAYLAHTQGICIHGTHARDMNVRLSRIHTVFQKTKCTFAFIRIYTYIYIYISHMYVYIRTRSFAFIRIYICTNMHAFVRMFTIVFIYMFTVIYGYIYARIYMYAYICLFMCMYVSNHTYVCMQAHTTRKDFSCCRHAVFHAYENVCIHTYN